MNDDALEPRSGQPLSPARSTGAVVRVDRSHAVCLSGEAAGQVSDTLGRATREGFKLARSARPGDVFELVPPKELAKGLREGTLRPATPKRGDASVLVKNVKDGRIAGKSDLHQVKPTAVDVIGPAAWQALALATQQHYLAEISAQLDGIKAGVDEVLARLDDEQIGALNHISEVAVDAEATAKRDGRLSAERVAEVRAAAGDAKKLWHQIATTARRQLEQYREGGIEAEKVEQTFAMLAHATRVLAQCSDALVALPYATADQLAAAVADEQDRLHPALPEFLGLCEELLGASVDWQEALADYEAHRPKNRVARLLRVPPVEVKRGKRGLETNIQFRPRQAALSAPAEDQLRRVVTAPTDETLTVLVEVQSDGTLLVGPAEPA